jgi:hypothetical protein
MYLVGFPLLLISFAIYNIVAFLMPGIVWADPVTRVPFASGGEWTMSLGDMLVALSVFLLLIEIIKAYRLGGRNLVDHGLSILLLLAAGAEFYLVPRAATSTFFLVLVASFADVVGGLVAMRKHRPVILPHEHEAPTMPESAPPPDVEPVTTASVEPPASITPAPGLPLPVETVIVPAAKPASDKV